MSFLESRNRGLPYGAIPYTELLNKLEETDMSESPEDIQTNYNNYIRTEIIDRSLENPFLESDRPRRDPSISKSILGLRYNGARGKYEKPQHPELFYGFMDQDNRGLDNNPRLNEYQQQISTRMPNLQVRMGHNCVDIDHESPWTNQSLGQCRRDIQTSLAYNTKVFTDEQDGRALNRNFVVEYDHNKKPLIYKDILPETLQEHNHSKKTNTGYTTYSVPFVSTDNTFVPSYNNLTNVSLRPGTKQCRQSVKDHLEQNELNNAAMQSKMTVPEQEHKMKNINTDHVLSEHYTNNNNAIVPGHKYIKNDAVFQGPDSTTVMNSKNALINPITNPNYFSNDSVLYDSSNNTESRRSDIFNTYNNTGSVFDIQTDKIIGHEANTQKKVLIYNNNVYNSTYYIPHYQFRDIDISKSVMPFTSECVANKVRYDIPDRPQDETYMRVPYRFTDNIGRVMTNTHAIVPDTTNETHLRRIGYQQQDHKLKNNQTEDVWQVSDENTTGKTQKQSRTGGIEPVVIEVPESHDFEVKNTGKNIGSKSIRGDKISNELDDDVIEKIIN